MRHPALPLGEGYDGEIPGHDHLEDQSANSHFLNEGGKPQDVLFNTQTGQHFFKTHQIARLAVIDVQSISVPNPNAILKDKKGNPVGHPHFSFSVIHDPTPCMRPHCIIQALKEKLPTKTVNKTVEVAIRRAFANIAEKHRVEMLEFTAQADASKPEAPLPEPVRLPFGIFGRILAWWARFWG